MHARTNKHIHASAHKQVCQSGMHGGGKKKKKNQSYHKKKGKQNELPCCRSSTEAMKKNLQVNVPKIRNINLPFLKVPRVLRWFEFISS